MPCASSCHPDPVHAQFASFFTLSIQGVFEGLQFSISFFQGSSTAVPSVDGLIVRPLKTLDIL